MSATDAGETGGDGGEDGPPEDGDVSFAPEAVRERLPADLSDRQLRALVCAVRNPDATPFEISYAAAVEQGEVVRALSGLAHGTIGTDTEGRGQARERRGDMRYARNFHELTDKQQAIVDFRARHDPEFTMSGAAVARGINRDDEYTVAVDETTVPTFENGKYASRLDGLVHERRDLLAAQGGLPDETNEQDRAAAAHRLDTREYLDLAGVALPAENLDALDRVGDGLPEDVLLDMAFENASGGALPEADIPESVPVGAVETHLGEDRDTFADDDVEPGDVYIGEVNGVVEWGVWFTIGGDPDDPGDVSGVVPIERLASRGLDPDAFTVGDRNTVVVTGRSNTNDGKVRHRLALVDVGGDAADAEDADAPEAESGAAGEAEADGAETPDETEDADHAGESDPSGDASDEPGATMHEFPERLDRVAAEVTGAHKRINTVRDQLYDVEDRLDGLERDLGTLGEQVGENSAALPSEAEARELSEAAEQVSRASDEIADLRDRVDALESAVQNSVKRDVIDTVEDLADRVSRLERSAGYPDDVAAALTVLRDHGATIDVDLPAFNTDHE